MAPKSAPVDLESATGLSVNETRFLKAIFDNMTQRPDADWAMVAASASLKDAKCAKERFRQISKKYNWNISVDANAATNTTSSPPKKNGALAVNSEGAKVTKKRTPPKKKAPAPKRSEAVVPANDDDTEPEADAKSEPTLDEITVDTTDSMEDNQQEI